MTGACRAATKVCFAARSCDDLATLLWMLQLGRTEPQRRVLPSRALALGCRLASAGRVHRSRCTASPSSVKRKGRMGDSLEQGRLAALKGLSILDTPHEPLFDSFVSLVAESFSVPVALISLVDEHRQWFKAVKGLSIDQTARAVAFCDHTIRSGDVMLVPDATQDERFLGNPLVTGAPHIRFYAGAPLVAPDNHRVGTLSLIGFEPRRGFPPREAARLKVLADTIMQTLIQRALALQAEQLDTVRSLLMREVDHRARNALSVVQSIVHLSRAPDIRTFKELILGRISALARAQGALTQRGWTAGSARRVVEDELAVLAQPPRGRVTGDDMAVAARDVQPLAMIVHELATNAVKHGALSVESGVIEVTLTATNPGLTICWREFGGPSVTTPERSGFGSRMIRELSGQLDAGLDVEWPPSGLQLSLRLPATRHEDRMEEAPATLKGVAAGTT